MSRIGFIGLGVMGAPMAGHLIAAGHSLFLRTHGEGNFSGLPVTAKIALDPNIIIGGLTFRY